MAQGSPRAFSVKIYKAFFFKLNLMSGIELLFFVFVFIYFNWGLITLQYCSGFCHTLT